MAWPRVFILERFLNHQVRRYSFISVIRNVIREGRSMLYTVHGRTKLEVLGGISHPLATFSFCGRGTLFVTNFSFFFFLTSTSEISDKKGCFFFFLAYRFIYGLFYLAIKLPD